MNILKLFIFTTFLAIGFTGYSQTVIASQPNAIAGFSYAGSAGTGQSFTITFDGEITSISVLPASNATATLYIFDNANADSTASGNPIYTQAGINLVSASSTDPLQEIILNTPVPITKSQVYSFVFEEPGNSIFFHVSFSTPYLAGNGLQKATPIDSSYNPIVGADLTFEVKGTPNVTVTPITNAIPSSSVLSLLLMLGLITGLVIARKSIFNKN